MRLIAVIVAANFAGGLIAVGLGSVLVVTHSVNYFQAGLILLGVAINMAVGTAIGSRPVPTDVLTGFQHGSAERARRGQPDV
jgi:hypothetical protein